MSNYLLKQFSIDLYEYNELSEKAKETAYLEWLANNEYFFAVDNENVLKAFCDTFNISVIDWEYTECNNSYTFSFDNEKSYDLKGEKLFNYLRENYFDIIDNYDTCPLTGYYLDHDILENLYNYISDYNGKMENITFEKLIDDCLQEFFNACSDDYAYYNSEENFKELNEYDKRFYDEKGILKIIYYFDENGKEVPFLI